MAKTQLGWVYVLHNPSFKHNMIKIGFTNKPTPQQRAQELSKHTGVPTEFEVLYAVQVYGAQDLETRVHQLLQHKRANHNREFFECSVDEAVKTIRQTAGKNVLDEMDLRGGNAAAFRQPETAKKPNSRKKNSPNKQKNRGLIVMMIVLILFLAAMLVVGWNVEQKEKAQSPHNASQSQTLPERAAKHNDVPADDVAATWQKIAPEIRATLQEEQDKWLQDKQNHCAQSANRVQCEREWNGQRVKYLRGFII